MTLEFQPADDFSSFIDGAETVTLRRRGCDETISVPTAYRLKVTAEEALSSDGKVEQYDTDWHLQLPSGTLAPSVGDMVIDAQDRCWTILEVKHLTRLERWKCSTRELSVAYGVHDRVVVERPVWDYSGTGPAVSGWNYAFTALPVRIQPLEVDVAITEDGIFTKAYFEIIFAEQVALEPYDRFVAEDGTIYTMVSYEGAERIDELPVVKVLRQEAV